HGGRAWLDAPRAPRRRGHATMAGGGPRPDKAGPPQNCTPWGRQEKEVKIGIVSPYAYPRPGGANSYIRESYTELRRLGHDVRIITAPWGDDPPAQDVIPIGQAIAVPYNGAIGRITLSLRLEWLVSRMLEREQFNIIHHHEPL